MRWNALCMMKDPETLGEYEGFRFSYRTMVFDALQMVEPFLYHCGAFLVPKAQAHEWLFSSEEGEFRWLYWRSVECHERFRCSMFMCS